MAESDQVQSQRNKKKYASLHHSYDVEMACEYGPSEATIIHNFQHWITLNRTMKRNFHEGRYWTYQTLEEIAAHYPYWTKSQVFDLLERLCSGKNRKSKKEKSDFEPVLMKGNFNKTTYDRTIWYAFVDEAKFLPMPYEEIGKSQNRNGEIPTPIPNTESTTELSQSSSFQSEDIERRKKDNSAKQLAPVFLKVKVRDNISLTQKQIDTLRLKHTEEDVNRLINKLSAFKKEKHKEYSSDYKAILNWVELWLRNEKGRALAEEEKGQKNEETKLLNLKKIQAYIEHRERVGAIGILCHDSDEAWDQNRSKFRWSMDDENMMDKIRKFYG